MALNVDLILGVLVCKGLCNQPQEAKTLPLLRAAEANIRERLRAETLSDHPKIAEWREAHQNSELKVSSIEEITRHVLTGGELPCINPIVDIYNAISLKHILPVGGNDLDPIENGADQITEATQNACLIIEGLEHINPRLK